MDKMLGYTPEQYKLFKKNAWIVLLGFSLLYCFLYSGRLNLQNAIPLMEKEEGWTSLQLGILSSIYFWTYGMGHLFNGRLGELFGVNKFIVIGVFLSAVTNILIGFQSSLVIICVLWGFNGYFQSMCWSPGIALISRWWTGDSKGFATGFANAASGLGQVAAAFSVVIAFAIGNNFFPSLGWRAAFIFPVMVMVVVAIIYIFVVKGRPSDVGLKDYVDVDPEREAQDAELLKIIESKGKLYPYMYLFKQWRFDMWMLIIACSSICRYGLMNWMPKYYVDVHNYDITAGIMGTLMLPLGMAFGALIVPWLTDKFCSKNRLPAIIICAVIAAVDVFIFKGVGPGVGASVLLFIAGFVIYGVNSVVWAYATDIGGRVFAGTAAGILDCAAYLGASIQAIFYGAILMNNNWNLLFTTVIGVSILMGIIAIIAGIGLKKDQLPTGAKS